MLVLMNCRFDECFQTTAHHNGVVEFPKNESSICYKMDVADDYYFLLNFHLIKMLYTRK